MKFLLSNLKVTRSTKMVHCLLFLGLRPKTELINCNAKKQNCSKLFCFCTRELLLGKIDSVYGVYSLQNYKIEMKDK